MPQLTSPHLLLEISLAAGVLSLSGFVFGLVGLTAAVRTGRRFKRWKSVNTSADLEQVYERTVGQVRALTAELDRVRNDLEGLRTALQHKVSTPGILRYNAFADMGSDLSFSLALLDDHGNGVVLSSIYGREESRIFAKPVHGGDSDYPLSDEEMQVIQEVQGASTASEQQDGRRPVRV